MMGQHVKPYAGAVARAMSTQTESPVKLIGMSVALLLLSVACGKSERAPNVEPMTGASGGAASGGAGSSSGGATSGGAAAASTGGGGSGAGGIGGESGGESGGAAGTGGAGTGGAGGSSSSWCAPEDTRRALFVGNSYTAVNNLPGVVSDLATAVGCDLSTSQISPGGARFSTHAANESTMDQIRMAGWDIVVLQNQSQVPGFRPEDVRADSLPHAVSLVSAAREATPQPRVLFFVTWGRRDGDADNCGYYPLVCDFVGHTTALSDGYTIYADETGAEMALAGPAWADAVADPALPFAPGDLWSGDGSHPSLRGTYLTALVVLQQIYGKVVADIGFTAGLSLADAEYLQRVAARQ